MAQKKKITYAQHQEIISEIKKTAAEKIKKDAQDFEYEFRKQATTAIIAAFGLIIATAWKDVIVSGINSLLSINQQASGLGNIITAVILTLIGTIGILIVSRWVQAPRNNDANPK
jgi:predicted ribosome-associated RNA-binding protein Tma20